MFTVYSILHSLQQMNHFNNVIRNNKLMSIIYSFTKQMNNHNASYFKSNVHKHHNIASKAQLG